ncbi:hypothetical protein ONZ45_g9857 [Pleurotus djamor]|nr:hypothetical protein ONZ45_g9857 [Pleurotus djamor]
MSEADREVPDDQCPPATPGNQNLPSTYINRLTPPPGTDFWRLQTFNVMTDQEIGGGAIVDAPTQILTWNIDAYVYTVNARPGQDFSEQGGLIYVVLVHHGSAATGRVTNRSIEYRYNVGIASPPPDTIAFSQDMQMFRNAGNELATFPAQYENTIYLRNASCIVQLSLRVALGV